MTGKILYVNIPIINDLNSYCMNASLVATSTGFPLNPLSVSWKEAPNSLLANKVSGGLSLIRGINPPSVTKKALSMTENREVEAKRPKLLDRLREALCSRHYPADRGDLLPLGPKIHLFP